MCCHKDFFKGYIHKRLQYYFYSSHIIKIQGELSSRAYELLELPEDEPCVILDVGCGSGLSGEVLSENGHQWIGLDISKDMLSKSSSKKVKNKIIFFIYLGVAKEYNDAEGDLLLMDMGCGLPFKPGVFDGVIRFKQY